MNGVTNDSQVYIRILGKANGSLFDDPMWLVEYDAAAHNGRGRVVMSPDRRMALTMGTRAALMMIYTAPPNHPVRLLEEGGDGRPNLPITAYHLELVKVEEA
jgi:hypothetical protein